MLIKQTVLISSNEMCLKYDLHILGNKKIGKEILAITGYLKIILPMDASDATLVSLFTWHDNLYCSNTK